MENAQLPQEICRIYDDYLNDTIWLEATHKPTEGLLGFGRRPDTDPCHDRFLEQLEPSITAISKDAPSSEVALAILRFIFEAPIAHKDNKQAYWMLLAVHGLTDKLIGFLSPEDSAGLTAWYGDAYPKHVRLPVQNAIAAHLQSQAGSSKPKRKGLLERFRGAKQG